MFLTPAVGGSNVAKDSSVKAAVLDIALTDHLVDLSLKPEFVEKVNVNGVSDQKQKVFLTFYCF